MCNSNTELPGTWEEADFTGGETDMAGIVAVGIAKDIVFGHAKQLSTSDRTKLLPDNPDPGGQPCMCRFVGDDLVQQCGYHRHQSERLERIRTAALNFASEAQSWAEDMGDEENFNVQMQVLIGSFT